MEQLELFIDELMEDADAAALERFVWVGADSSYSGGIFKRSKGEQDE